MAAARSLNIATVKLANNLYQNHMTDTNLPPNHPKIEKKIGVLILNLGTPDGYGYFAIRRYLKQFLSDQRVIEVNPILWQVILNLFILPLRPIATCKK